MLASVSEGVATLTQFASFHQRFIYLFICEIAGSMTENTKESDSYFEFPPLINV